MSLTWFKIPIADFLKETRRLSLGAKGAYLALLCDYYENGPLPYDRISLENIMGIAGDDAQSIWMELSGLFQPAQPEDGHWHHARADKEIADRSKASERAVTNGSKGGRKPVRAVHERDSGPGSGHERDWDRDEVARQKPTTLAIVPSDGDDAPDLTSAPRVETTSSFIGKPPETAPPPPPEEDDDDEPFRPMPSDFKLDAVEIAQCRADGATFEQIAIWFDEWKAKHLQAGTTAQDWKVAWETRFAARLKAASRPRPRVEVSRKA